jgi:hypothetical protein
MVHTNNLGREFSRRLSAQLDIEVESREQHGVIPVQGVTVERWVFEALPLAEAGQEAVDVVRARQTRRLRVQNLEPLQDEGHRPAKGRVVVQQLNLKITLLR